MELEGLPCQATGMLPVYTSICKAYEDVAGLLITLPVEVATSFQDSRYNRLRGSSLSRPHIWPHSEPKHTRFGTHNETVYLRIAGFQQSPLGLTFLAVIKFTSTSMQ